MTRTGTSCRPRICPCRLRLPSRKRAALLLILSPCSPPNRRSFIEEKRQSIYLSLRDFRAENEIVDCRRNSSATHKPPGPKPLHSSCPMESSMHWKSLGLALAFGAASLLAQTAPQPAPAPQIWTWDAVKNFFELNNTSLHASRLNIDELKAQEITAHLRPNPDFTLTADGTQIAPSHGVWTPFAGTFVSPGVSYL